MTLVAVGAVGFLLGLAAHDIALQALSEGTPLRPLVGVCRRCGNRRGRHLLRCPSCGLPAWRELIVVITTASAAVAFYWAVGPSWELIPYLGFLFLSAALVITDLEVFRLVDRLNIPGTAVLLIVLAATSLISGNLPDLGRGLAGAAAYLAGSSLVFIAVRGRGFGFGDVKLSIQLGLFTAYLSWGTLGWAVFGTAVIGGLVAGIMLLIGGAGLKTELPYGPAMVLGAWTAIAMVGVGAIPISS